MMATDRSQMPSVTYPRLVLRSIGLSLRLCRLVLGLTQQQAGELLGMTPVSALPMYQGYEKGAVRMNAGRLTAVIALQERACIYAMERFGQPQAKPSMPQANDPEYALKLFKYWQANDGTKSGLRRLIPYLAARDAPKRPMQPLPPDPNRVYSPDELDVRAPRSRVIPSAAEISLRAFADAARD